MKTRKISWLSLVLCLALLAAAALCTVSLAETTVSAETETPVFVKTGDAVPSDADGKVILLTGTKDAPVVLGEGKLVMLFHAMNEAEEVDAWFEIHTDAETVGAALLENELVAGSESEYGLYVTSVCGMELIWSEENPHYWAFYVDDEYAQTGVDATPIEEGKTYVFKAE